MAGANAKAVAGVAGTLAAAALAVTGIAQHEGWRNVGYRDPAPGAYETICVGHMQAGTLGKRFTDKQCADLLAQDAVKAGLNIAPCLPDALPVETRAAFISIAFNIGAPAFCKSSMSKKALAGDLKGACASLSLYTKAGGVDLPGLVRRRAEERKLCESGL